MTTLNQITLAMRRKHITANEYKERIKILYPGLELIELPDKKADGGKPKKFQSGRSSALDDPNSLDIMAPFKSPDMGLWRS